MAVNVSSERSIARVVSAGPQPSTVHVADLPVLVLVTVTTVPLGSVRCAHVAGLVEYQLASPSAGGGDGEGASAAAGAGVGDDDGEERRYWPGLNSRAWPSHELAD